MTQSSDYMPWEEIADSSIFPAGIYLFEIGSFDPVNYSGGGKLMPKIMFVCREPKQFNSLPHWEQYCVGTDENPEAVNAGTFAARNLKAALNASQTPKSNSLEELSKTSIGNRLLIQFGEPTTDDYGIKSNAVAYHKVGEREVGPLKTKGGGAAKPVATGPTGPPPAGAGGPASATRKKPQTVVCTVCNKPIPVAEYSEHIESCTGP